MPTSSDVLHIALLGAGWFGREAHLRNLLQIEGVEVVAASSRSEASRQAARQIAGDRLRVFADWREALTVEPLDAVIVALTNDQHYAAAMAALKAGKHVLCEKPLALTVRECDELIDAALSRERVLQVGHEMRFQRLYQRMHSMVRQGAVGQPVWMWCREFRGPMRPGWRSSQQLTGGTLLEKNSHHFDLFTWILDVPPVRVAATGGRDVLTDREILDNAQVIVEHAGGRRSMLELCLFAPHGGDTEIGIVGSEGRLDTWNQRQTLVHHRFDWADRCECRIAEDERETGFRDAAGRIDRGIRAELLHFIECCRTGQRPLTDGESGKIAVAVCLAAQEAIRRGDWVALDEVP